MARLVVHLGPGKTGTTLIQRTLAAQRDQLLNKDWVVPFFTSERHHEVALAMDDRDYIVDVPAVPTLTTLGSRRERLKLISDQLDREVKPEQTWIMSSEYFQLVMWNQDKVREFAEYFARWFSEITAIAYVRRQDQAVPSMFTQGARTLVKDRRDLTFDASYLSHPRCRSLDRMRVCRMWRSEMGEGFRPRPYLDSWRKSSTALLSDFIAASGVPLELPDPNSQEGPRRVNESTSARSVAFLLWLYPEINRRILTQKSIDAVGTDLVGQLLRQYVSTGSGDEFHFNQPRFIAEIGAATPGPPLRLTKEMAAAIEAKYSGGNGKLAREFAATGDWQQWLNAAGPPIGDDHQLDLSRSQALSIVKSLTPRQSTPVRIRRRLGDLARKVGLR